MSTGILREATKALNDTVDSMVAGRAERTIQQVPALLIALLDDAGKLPCLPDATKEDGATGRHPKLEEVVSLAWVLCWNSECVNAKGFATPVGVLAYRDVYDYPTGRDVREVIHLAGSPRAVLDLISWARKDAGGRHVIGSVSMQNTTLELALQRLGGAEIRRVWELS